MAGPMKLTPKQARFVQEYLIDLNAAQAAIRAGYSAKTARVIGHENLIKPDIAAAIEKAMAERAERTELTADWVVDPMKPRVRGSAHLRAVHQTLASGRAVTTNLPIQTVVQRIPSGPNGIQRIPAESPANDAPSLASCNWRIPTGGSPAQ